MIEVGAVVAVVIAVYFLFLRKKDSKKIKEDVDIYYSYGVPEVGLLIEINKYRVGLGLSSLEVNNYISSLCIEHNANMELQGEPSHNGFAGKTQRIETNLGVTSVGENVAYNYSSANATLKAWIKSPEHR